MSLEMSLEDIAAIRAGRASCSPCQGHTSLPPRVHFCKPKFLRRDDPQLYSESLISLDTREPCKNHEGV